MLFEWEKYFANIVGSPSDEQSWSGVLLDKDGVEKFIKALNELREEM